METFVFLFVDQYDKNSKRSQSDDVIFEESFWFFVLKRYVGFQFRNVSTHMYESLIRHQFARFRDREVFDGPMQEPFIPFVWRCRVVNRWDLTSDIGC